MYCFDKQRIFTQKNYDHAQGVALYVLPGNLKFQVRILIRVMNHFAPIENVKNIQEIYIPLRHAFFSAVPTESHDASFCNSPDLRFNMFNIQYHHFFLKFNDKINTMIIISVLDQGGDIQNADFDHTTCNFVLRYQELSRFITSSSQCHYIKRLGWLTKMPSGFNPSLDSFSPALPPPGVSG
jgi:hypothetical protein